MSPDQYTRRMKLRDWSIAGGLIAAVYGGMGGLMYAGVQVAEGAAATARSVDAFTQDFTACSTRDIQAEVASGPDGSTELRIIQDLPPDGVVRPYSVLGATLVSAAFSARGATTLPEGNPRTSELFDNAPPPINSQAITIFHIPEGRPQEVHEVYQITRLETSSLGSTLVESEITRCGRVAVNFDPNHPAAQPEVLKIP